MNDKLPNSPHSPHSSHSTDDTTENLLEESHADVPASAPGAASGGGASVPTSTPPAPAQAPAASTSDDSTDVPPNNTPMNHHDSMCFLKIIGSIQSGQKLRHSSNNPNQPISIDPNQWSSSVTRWWNGDSRTMSIKVLRGRFDNVFKNIDESYELHKNPSKKPTNAFHRSPKDILLDYARELSGAEKGLRHLCHTYKSDIPIASEL